MRPLELDLLCLGAMDEPQEGISVAVDQKLLR